VKFWNQSEDFLQAETPFLTPKERHQNTKGYFLDYKTHFYKKLKYEEIIGCSFSAGISTMKTGHQCWVNIIVIQITFFLACQ